MAIISKQIGYSQESTLLYELLRELNRLSGIVGAANNAPTEITFSPSTAQDSFGRLRVSNPLTLFDSSHRYADNNLWSTGGSGGTATFNSNQGLIDLIVPLTPGTSVIRGTTKVFSYQPGKSLLVLNTFVMNPAVTGLTQRVGYYGADNGYYVQLADSTLSFVERSSISGGLVNTPVAQANWNGDKLDGNGASGITLDITKSQIFWMDIEWLGVGSVRTGFVIDGQFILCHTFQHANIVASTYITSASLPLRYEIINTSSVGGTATLKQICSSVISEGGYELRGTQLSVGIPITTPRTFAVAGTYYPIIGLKLLTTRLDAVVIASAISLLGLGNGKNYAWRLVQSGTIVGGTWVPLGGGSAVEYNISGTSITGGSVEASGYVNSSNQGSPVVNILRDSLFRAQLERNGLTGTPFELILEAAVSTTSGGEGMLASIDWEEISR